MSSHQPVPHAMWSDSLSPLPPRVHSRAHTRTHARTHARTQAFVGSSSLLNFQVPEVILVKQQLLV